MAAKKGRNPFVWIIMILLFVGLLGFGTGGLGGNIRSLGTVGTKDVSIAAYQNGLNQQLRAFEAQTGQRVTFSEARTLGIDQAVLQQLIAERTLDNEAAELGISVGDERVREEVLRVPAFQDLSGNFDREGYRLTLERSGLSEAQFEASIRDEVARTLLQGAVVGGIPAPDAFADAVIQFASETRNVTFAPFTVDMLKDPLPGPTDADLQAFYDANPDLFTAPEARAITYAWITPEMIQDDITVDETDLRALYDSRLAEFVRPERRLVERLVFAGETPAAEAQERITNGEADFDTLVAERGLELSDVDMGDVAQDDLGAAGGAVFAATPGDVVGPFNTSLGPALFRVNAVLAAEEISFEEARDDLNVELSAQRAIRQIDAASEGINDLMAGGATLENLAEQTELVLGSIDWTPETRDGIAAYDSFRAAAAAAVEGAFPNLEQLADGGIFALRLDGITPPAVRPFAEVRDDVVTAWTAQSTQAAVLAQAETTAALISPLTGFETLELTPTAANTLTRTTFVEGTPPAFLEAVFEMNVGEVRVIDNESGALIVRLDGTAPPDPANPQVAAQLEQAGAQAAQGIAQDIFEAFNAAVQTRTDVSINQAAVDAVNAQLQ